MSGRWLAWPSSSVCLMFASLVVGREGGVISFKLWPLLASTMLRKQQRNKHGRERERERESGVREIYSPGDRDKDRQTCW